MSRVPPPQRSVAEAAQQGITGLQTPAWFLTLGTGAWLTLGIACVVALALLVVALVAEVAIPLAIAAVLAAILVPLVDRLERWRLPRWLGAYATPSATSSSRASSSPTTSPSSG